MSIFFTLFVGCEKEIMDFQGGESLYFDVRRGASWIAPSRWAHQYFTPIEFGQIEGKEMTVKFKIMATGGIKDYDRPFAVTINNDSTTAVSGVDYEYKSQNFIIKAGEVYTEVPVTFFRSANSDGDTLQLQLQIMENPYFQLKYTSFADDNVYKPDVNKMFDYNKNAGIHNIFIYDVLSRPDGWYGSDINGLGIFGKYSAKKYRLIMELSNTTISDFASSSTMPSARAVAIGELVAKYLIQKAKEKDPVIDEDGTMMFVSAVSTLAGSSAWAPFTKTEDYYLN